MKRIISILLLVTLCLSCFIACGGDDDKNGDGTSGKKLDAPTVKKGDGVITWDKVKHASGYEIQINKEAPISVGADVTSYPLLEEQMIKVRAIGDGKKYATSDWSKSVYISISFPEHEF